ncbi:hypothetical protein V490_02520 [Pseudogymnoascus sp. VKM F-3557]|nr:hypothetical protein V490_02520 [Pseudogymnoascus sp. VKM F-3557]
MATDEKGSGFVGDLSPGQEAKLQQLWTIILNTGDSQESPVISSINVVNSQNPAQDQHRRLSSLSRVKTSASADTKIPSAPTNCPALTEALQITGASATDIKSAQEIFSRMPSGELLKGFLKTIQHEHPDALMLRFLRARRWDVIKAFIMMAGVIEWRMKEIDVDQLMAEGELQALKQSQNTSNATDKKKGDDFLAQVRMGKVFVHSVDNDGRPICVVRVRLHRPGEQSEETLERYIVHFIESVRLMLVPPAETAAVVFDLTGFSLSNMEYPPVKFIIKCFEANYPESLGVLLIHKAPWVFSGIWRLIKGWLDPAIASKIYFTNNATDLEKFIPRDNIFRDLGGDYDWTYEYVEPNLDENDVMKDTATRDALLTERQGLNDDLLLATSTWIAVTTAKDEEKITACKDQRAAIANRLRSNYWQLDPYLRARTFMDRTGELKPPNCHPSEESLPKIGGSETEETAKMVKVEHIETIATHAIQS